MRREEDTRGEKASVHMEKKSQREWKDLQHVVFPFPSRPFCSAATASTIYICLVPGGLGMKRLSSCWLQGRGEARSASPLGRVAEGLAPKAAQHLGFALSLKVMGEGFLYSSRRIALGKVCSSAPSQPVDGLDGVALILFVLLDPDSS